MRGSMRQRSGGSWELRVFVGVDPETGRRRYRSMTVRGNRADADRELAAMVASVRATRSVGAGSSVSELHDLRHFMATEMLQAGVPLPLVSRRLDHRRVSTTLDCYAHAVPGGDAVAAQTLWHVVQRAG
jgi:integrase